MTAVAYTRTSTRKQSDSGFGLEAQRSAIEHYAVNNSLTILEWFSDPDVSGAAALERRPGLMAAIAAVPKQGFLIVAQRDRLARDPMVAGFVEIELARKKASVVSVAGEGTGDEGPTGKLIRGIIDLVAEFERAQIAARTKAAKAARKAQGGFIGGSPPYGFRRDGVCSCPMSGSS